jgi:phosphate starvation-inducible protein PhoH
MALGQVFLSFWFAAACKNMPETLTIPLPTVESAISLAGSSESNLKLLAKQTGAKWVLRGQELVIVGTAPQVAYARQLESGATDRACGYLDRGRGGGSRSDR